MKIIIKFLKFSLKIETKFLGNFTEKYSDEEKAELRLRAAMSIIKIIRNRKTDDSLVTPKYFQMLAGVAQDKNVEVRLQFLTKLNKGLKEMKLPIRYLAIPALAAIDKSKEVHSEAKYALQYNIKVRREFYKANADKIANTPGAQTQILPEYSIPHLIHLIAHLPKLKDDGEKLKTQGAQYIAFFGRAGGRRWGQFFVCEDFADRNSVLQGRCRSHFTEYSSFG